MLKSFKKNDAAHLYRMNSAAPLQVFIATSSGTRMICNDPSIAGMCYTNLLCQSCTEILRLFDFGLKERETCVVNILRGGLNFGLREALYHAYGWLYHTTSFISAQRARNSQDPEEWHITENAYRKVYFPHTASWVIGDVVATGTSLRYALEELLKEAEKQCLDLRNIVFFTYGGTKAAEILEEVDRRCRILFAHYQKTSLIYLEGCFQVA